MKKAILAVLALVLAAAAIFLLLNRRGGEKWNVLLITVDTLRADRLGCYGYDRAETPNIDGLAEKGVLFENAVSPIPSTLPSHSSIMTGLYPHQHGVRDNAVYYLPDEAETLGEVFSNEGYETAAFVSAFVLNSRFGIDQGFGLFDEELDEPIEKPGKERPDLPAYTRWWMERKAKPFQRSAEHAVEKAAGWLREVTGGDSAGAASEPFFCWVHLFDPHMPYNPPEQWLNRFPDLSDGAMDGTMDCVHAQVKANKGKLKPEHLVQMAGRYDAEIAYTDHWIGRLLAVLDETGARDRTIVVFTADHGESFGEHIGLFFEHNASVYDETLRVPLIVAPPSLKIPGTRNRSLTSLVDIFPTMLDLAGIDLPGGLPGRSLFGHVENEERIVYLEALCSEQAMPSPIHYRGVRSLTHKLFRVVENKSKGRRAWGFYNIAEDPGEKRDIKKTRGADFAMMEEALRRYLELGRESGGTPANFWPLQDDEERIEKMRALGYIK